MWLNDLVMNWFKEHWKDFLGGLIAIFGAWLLITPSYLPNERFSANNIYDLFSNAMNRGIVQLTSFKHEISECPSFNVTLKNEPAWDTRDCMQRIKSLNSADDPEAFSSLLQRLIEIQPDELQGRIVKQITNRRQNEYKEFSGESLTVMNAIHVCNTCTPNDYTLVATENNLRSAVMQHKNYVISAWGIIFVVLGTLFKSITLPLLIALFKILTNAYCWLLKLITFIFQTLQLLQKTLRIKACESWQQIKTVFFKKTGFK